jgi:hypothetical protein
VNLTFPFIILWALDILSALAYPEVFLLGDEGSFNVLYIDMGSYLP